MSTQADSGAALFGDFIALLRQQSRLSQKQLSERVACDPSVISRLESGLRGRDIDMLLSVSCALSFDISALAHAYELAVDGFQGTANELLAAVTAPPPAQPETDQVPAPTGPLSNTEILTGFCDVVAGYSGLGEISDFNLRCVGIDTYTLRAGGFSQMSAGDFSPNESVTLAQGKFVYLEALETISLTPSIYARLTPAEIWLFEDVEIRMPAALKPGHSGKVVAKVINRGAEQVKIWANQHFIDARFFRCTAGLVDDASLRRMFEEAAPQPDDADVVPLNRHGSP